MKPLPFFGSTQKEPSPSRPTTRDARFKESDTWLLAALSRCGAAVRPLGSDALLRDD